mmetsp:Transcript_56604/g.133286  ORF Transcript_56604/g.133286 Transcript_56604/m.133286 type:complete len:141 (+) Transcript_56604:26-448(+)
MLLHGVGVDLAHVPRFARILSRFGDRFAKRVLHGEELSQLATLTKSGLERARFIASRWAAKEALHKAVGSQRLEFTQISVQKRDQKPTIVAQDVAADELRRLGVGTIHLSISHDADFATAFVVLERTSSQSSAPSCEQWR